MNERVVVRYGGLREMLGSLGAVTVCVVLGGASLYAGIVTDKEGRVTAMVLGSIFLVVGLSMTAGMLIPGRRKSLVFSRDSVHWRGPGDRAWTLRWEEIGRIRVETTKISGGRATVYTVWVMIAIHDLHQVSTRFPELSKLRGHKGAAVDEITLPIGHRRQVVPQLMAALDRFAGAANGGLNDRTSLQGDARGDRE